MSAIHPFSLKKGHFTEIARLPHTAISLCVCTGADKVHLVFQKILGYCLRAVVFMFGEYKSSPLKYFIMERCGKGGLCDTRGRAKFDPARLERSRDIFKRLGCELAENGKDFPMTVPRDGHAKIEYCHIKYENVKEAIETHGGEWIELSAVEEVTGHWVECREEPGEKIEVIVQNETLSKEEWRDFYENSLSKMGWTPIILRRNGKSTAALLTAKWSAKQQRPTPGLCFIRSHSPTSSWAMERHYVAQHLSLHADLFLYDYRGTYKSEGIPSEGGYNLDIRAVYEEAKKRGYPNEKIFATGFCLGGGPSSSLRREGDIHLVLENSFDSLERVLDTRSWLIRWLAKIGLPEIQSKEKEIRKHTHQNYFNAVEHLQNAKYNDKRTTFLIDTKPDTLLAPDAPERLSKAAAKAGSVFSKTFYPPSSCKNGHSLNPLDDASVWQAYVQKIAGITAAC